MSRTSVGWFMFLAALSVLMGACSSSAEVEAAGSPQTSTTSVSTTLVPTTSSPTTASPTTEMPTTTTLPGLSVEACAAAIDLDVRLGQLLLPVVLQEELELAAELAGSGHIAGVVVLGAPTGSIADDLAVIQASSLVGPSIIAVDEEGGRVQRLESLVGQKPSARTVAATMTPQEARSAAADHGEQIAALGFTMNLAPVLDLDTGSYIGNRSFSDDPAIVKTFALAVADGILDAGLSPTVKHFPGHGRGTDSHLGLPVLPSLHELRRSDLGPFVAAIERGDLPIMVGHLIVPDLTGDEPASLSPAAIDGLLRTELGFDGLVMTDAFNMDAISVDHGNAAAAELAIVAGVDLAMLGRLDDVPRTLDGLIEAVEAGRISETSINESFLRVLDHKGLDVCDLPAALAPGIRCDGVNNGGCSLASG